MGRNKIDIQYIKDDRIRNVNFFISTLVLLFLEALYNFFGPLIVDYIQ